MSQEKAVIYARVSSEKQGSQNRASIPEQLKTCRDLAAREGLQVVAEFVDRERYKSEKGRLVEPSGTRLDRPGLTNMLVGAGQQWTVLIAWAQDRLARGSAATVYIRDIFEQSRVKVLLVTGGWDTDTAELLGAVSGYELRRIKQRMSMGKQGRIESGLHIGEVPFGYRIVRDADGKSIGYAIVEPEAEQLRQMAALYLAHHSVVEVAHRLGSNLRTGKPWLASTVQYVLANPFYYGKIVYGRSRPPGEAWIGRGTHPLAWSDATLGAVERERARRRELYRRGPRRSKHDHLFSGVVRCAICGRPMSSQAQTQSGNLTKHYRCNTAGYERVGIVGHTNHGPNHISELKLLTQLTELVASLSEEEFGEALRGMQAPERVAVNRERLLQREAHLAGRELELSAGMDALKNLPVAASAIETELIRVQGELEEVRRMMAVDDSRPASSEAVLAGAGALRAALISGQADWAELRRLIIDNIGALYVAGGRLAVRANEQG